jgi:hypothetical protein
MISKLQSSRDSLIMSNGESGNKACRRATISSVYLRKTEREEPYTTKSMDKDNNYLDEAAVIEREKERVKRLNEFRERHNKLVKTAIESIPEAMANDVEKTKIEMRIERKVELCHKNVNWFLSKFATVLYPKFGPDQDMLSRKKKSPLPKLWKSVASWMAHGRQRRKLMYMMSLNGNDLIDPSESCSTLLGACCGTLHSPGITHINFKGSRRFIIVPTRCARQSWRGMRVDGGYLHSTLPELCCL